MKKNARIKNDSSQSKSSIKTEVEIPEAIAGSSIVISDNDQKRVQIAFRLTKDKQQQLQLIALQKKMTVQEILERAVEDLLRGAFALTESMKKVIVDLFENRLEELKMAIYECAKKTLDITDRPDWRLRLIVDDVGEISKHEDVVASVPLQVREGRAYVLYEFQSEYLTLIASESQACFDNDSMIAPFQQTSKNLPEPLDYRGFFKWYIGKYGDDKYSTKRLECLGVLLDTEDEIELISKTHIDEVSDEEMLEFVDSIVTQNGIGDIPALKEWDPISYRKYKSYILDIVETHAFNDPETGKEYPNWMYMKCKMVIDEICSRDELAFVGMFLKDHIEK